MSTMLERMQRAPDLDTILVLSGPLGPTFDNRSFAASQAYQILRPDHFIVSGNYTGVKDLSGAPHPPRPDAEVIKERMVGYLVPQERIIIERDALDTAANFIYAEPILREYNRKGRRVGLITDGYHMRRSMAIGQHIYGSKFTLYALPTDDHGGEVMHRMEQLLQWAIMRDLRQVQSGDEAGFKQYLRERHPFHALKAGNKPPMSAYGGLVHMKAFADRMAAKF
jgi:hypothetical protein